MRKIAGIKFKNGGKVYDFESFALVLNSGDKVIVETEQGQGLGIVEIPPKEFDEKHNKKDLKQILRVATVKDLEKREDNIQLESRAFSFCEKCVNDLKLVMNLFSVESTFDRNKLIFFYTADGRVDFRELVKLLVKEYNIRIEMRQVGIRNLAKHCGGVGKCGRELCCSSFINNFAPVSIKMAKTQGLSLNPAKISGVCGRLMCCLTFEDSVYNKTRSMLPKIGAKVEVNEGRGKVIRQNVLKEKLTIRLEDNTEIEKYNSEIL
jgi:cell fate regulator YaaT (PSP1 superfamily)